jgi:hypothetical protein
LSTALLIQRIGAAFSLLPNARGQSNNQIRQEKMIALAAAGRWLDNGSLTSPAMAA